MITPLEQAILSRLLKHSSEECEFKEVGECIFCETHGVRIGVTGLVVKILDKYSDGEDDSSDS